MSSKLRLLQLSLPFVCLLFGNHAAFSQVKSADPASKPIKVRKEPDENRPFERWLKEDVAYIITAEETAAFKRLKNNAERENFIENFWRRRDPDPDTQENEYREEYYERIAYANQHFSTGIPGWKTDRGRIYIARGKPDSVESYPAGGSYNRPSYQGGGSTSVYPFEIWFYRHLDGVGDGLEIEFVDPTGTGEYRLARNPDEKDALANVPGAGFKASGNTGGFLRAQDMPFERLRIITDITRAPAVKFPDLALLANSGTGILENESSIDFDLQIDFFKQSDERVATTFTLQTENKELAFEDAGGIQSAALNIFGKIIAVTGTKAGNFEDVVTVSSSAQELVEAKNNKSIYQNAVSLPSGTYKIIVAVRDTKSGKVGKVEKGFTVPKFNSEKLSTSTLILASRLSPTTSADIGGRFVIGDKKVIPNLSGVYRKGQEIGVYLQIYNAPIDPTTLKPAVDAEYILLRNGKEIARNLEISNDLTDSGQRLTLAKLIPTNALSGGDYEIKIKLRDRITNQSIEQHGKFTIIE